MQSKRPNGDGRGAREDGQINQHRCPTAAAQGFEKSQNSPCARGKGMARLFAPAAENRIEQRILEFLRHNRSGASRKSAAQTEPFEIAVVITDNNPALIRRKLGKFLQVDVTREIFPTESRTPH